MNAQTIQDIFYIAGMFFLRIVAPMLLVAGIGYLIQRWLESKAVHEQFDGMMRNVQEQQPGALASGHVTSEAKEIGEKAVAAPTPPTAHA
jgi:hypothetical protein